MTYNCRYTTNSIFPYRRKINNYKKNQKNSPTSSCNIENAFSINSFFSNSFNNLFKPIEKIIGRKIAFDDLLLVGIIFLLFTEKERSDNTLLLCLLFILVG